MTLNAQELQDLEAQFSFDSLEEIAINVETEIIQGTDDRDDLLIGSANSEAIVGLSGNDSLYGKSGNDTLFGGQGDDEINSNGGNALLIGNEGNDTLSAVSNIEIANRKSTLVGSQGDDVLKGSSKEDLLFGGSDADTLFGNAGNDVVNGGTGKDTLRGDLGDDLVIGGDNEDILSGGDGNDVVNGGAGDDLFLIDTEGNDRFTGGAGNDTFILLPGNGKDTVEDFQEGQDRFALVEGFPREVTFEQLEITENDGNTIIALADTGEVLTELIGVSAETIDAEDFITIPSPAEEMQDDEIEMSDRDSQFSANLIDSQKFSELDRSADRDFDNTSSENQSEQLEVNAEVGAVTSQGVKAMNVSEARRDFAVDGEGVTIGVIANSFDRSLLADISATDDVLSGDLPGKANPNGYTTPVRVLDDSKDNSDGESASDEGRAMLQLIHDVAPGAELAFHTRGQTSEDFTGAIDNLVDAGADVIIDDVSDYSQPFFQDGITAQAVDAAVNNGVPYFTSAGNQGADSYQAEFRPVESENFPVDELDEKYVFHDFNPDDRVDPLQTITLNPGESTKILFQWDEPFASAGGKGASNDLDLFVFDAANNLVNLSTESNIETDAYEPIQLENNTEEAAEYKLAVGYDTTAVGSQPGFMKYVAIGGAEPLASKAEYADASSTIVANNNTANGVAVGAANYSQTPEFGANPTQISKSSSIGNTRILFDLHGNPLAEPEIRQKPEIVAPDATNTTFFGSDIDGDDFPNFTGTSAAAPHAGGVAALLLDANPEATPDQVYQALEQSALDMDNPYTQGADPGYDVATGYGFIQADLALEEILGTSDTQLASSSSEEAFI